MLHSQRLHLRALEPGDADFMYEVENDEQAWRYSDTIAPLSRRILRDYALNYDADPFTAGQLRLIITEKVNKNPVGIIDLYDVSQRHQRAYIGIYICKDYRGKGYAGETLDLIEDYAHNTLHLHQLGAKVEASHAKAEKLFSGRNYELQGELKDWLSTPDGKFAGMKIFTKKLKPAQSIE
ncbi:MAG: GNAT family N-acetyltransferase [Muribaculaceae bacterium]|nr:GNAT family N-acetyltransferase [Muribaculaceae bacterium]